MSQLLLLFFEIHSLWRDTLLSLDIVGKAFGPDPKLDFVNPPWETLPFLKSSKVFLVNCSLDQNAVSLFISLHQFEFQVFYVRCLPGSI